MTAVLEVEGLTTRFAMPQDGEVLAADDVGFAIGEGQSLGVVGESGSGKTPDLHGDHGPARQERPLHRAACGSAARRSWACRPAELNSIRGDRMAMIFQDPMTSLNPYLTIARQMTEVLVEHKGMSEAQARERALAMLDLVGIPEAAAPLRPATRTSSPAACASG